MKTTGITHSFSFNSATEEDALLVDNTKLVAESLDIEMMVLYLTHHTKSAQGEAKTRYNTKFGFSNARDADYIHYVWVQLQVGYSVEELLSSYYQEDLARFYN